MPEASDVGRGLDQRIELKVRAAAFSGRTIVSARPTASDASTWINSGGSSAVDIELGIDLDDCVVVIASPTQRILVPKPRHGIHRDLSTKRKGPKLQAPGRPGKHVVLEGQVVDVRLPIRANGRLASGQPDQRVLPGIQDLAFTSIRSTTRPRFKARRPGSATGIELGRALEDRHRITGK
jgi:hypothetical protein